MALRNSDGRVLLAAKHVVGCGTSGTAADAIDRLWITRLNQTARRRLAPIGPIRVVDAIAIQDGFHRDDIFLLDPEIPATAHPACG
jgi:hypothetical protein